MCRNTARPELETHSVSTGMSKEMNKNKVSYELADIFSERLLTRSLARQTLFSF